MKKLLILLVFIMFSCGKSDPCDIEIGSDNEVFKLDTITTYGGGVQCVYINNITSLLSKVPISKDYCLACGKLEDRFTD